MGDVVARNLFFPEGARWHEGAFWFADIFGLKVHRIVPGGSLETIAEVEHQPSGLGWLPDGRLLIVSMTDRKLLRLEGGALVEHADMSSHASYWCNDMVVDRKGRAYVSGVSAPVREDNPAPVAPVIFVDAQGGVATAAEGLVFPNGSVVTKDGKSLLISETAANRIAKFDIDEAGSLSNRRIFVDLPGCWPDGLSIDSEDRVWVADPLAKQLIRVLPSGVIDHTISLGDTHPMACAIGGEDERTVMACVVPELHFEALGSERVPKGWIELFRV